jgi:hypothetical protein
MKSTLQLIVFALAVLCGCTSAPVPQQPVTQPTLAPTQTAKPDEVEPVVQYTANYISAHTRRTPTALMGKHSATWHGRPAFCISFYATDETGQPTHASILADTKPDGTFSFFPYDGGQDYQRQAYAETCLGVK